MSVEPQIYFLSVYQSDNLALYQCTNLPVYQSIYLLVYQLWYLPVHQSMYLPEYQSTFYIFTSLQCTYLQIYQKFFELLRLLKSCFAIFCTFSSYLQNVWNCLSQNLKPNAFWKIEMLGLLKNWLAIFCTFCPVSPKLLEMPFSKTKTTNFLSNSNRVFLKSMKHCLQTHTYINFIYLFTSLSTYLSTSLQYMFNNSPAIFRNARFAQKQHFLPSISKTSGRAFLKN